MPGKLIDFYSGFEGEGEVKLYGADILSVWDGYFVPIMEILLEQEQNYRANAFGIVAEWATLTGWCDVIGEKQKILNLSDEIYAFSQFDYSKLDTMEYLCKNNDWKQKIIDVHMAIVELLKEAQEKNLDVYIEDC